MNELEIWIMIDEHGDYVIAEDQDSLHTVWAEQIGDTPTCVRVDCIRVKVELPKVLTTEITLPIVSAGAVLLSA